MLLSAIFVITHSLLDAANAIYYVKVADDEVGPNGRIKYRRRLLEKAAELQAERGRIVKTSGFTSRLRKGEVKRLVLF